MDTAIKIRGVNEVENKSLHAEIEKLEYKLE